MRTMAKEWENCSAESSRGPIPNQKGQNCCSEYTESNSMIDYFNIDSLPENLLS